MKITIEEGDTIATVEQIGIVTLDDTLLIIEQCLSGLGFVLRGNLEMVEMAEEEEV